MSKTRWVIGWHGDLVDDVQETGGWAWIRIKVLIWKAMRAREIVHWLNRLCDTRDRTTRM
jgi:hypothetical protein